MIGAAIRHTDHLVRTLASLGQGAPHRRRVAGLTCDAAYLAGWCTLILGDPRAAIGWYRVAERAARAAGDPDRIALMLLRRYETSLAKGWPEGEGREPAELIEDPLVRARFDLCARCMRA